MAHVLDPENKKVFFFDAPKSKQGEFIQCDFLEEVKNGCAFSPKCESIIKEFDTPHVVAMMNECPDMSKLSEDRHLIYVVDEEGSFTTN